MNIFNRNKTQQIAVSTVGDGGNLLGADLVAIEQELRHPPLLHKNYISGRKPQDYYRQRGIDNEDLFYSLVDDEGGCQKKIEQGCQVLDQKFPLIEKDIEKSRITSPISEFIYGIDGGTGAAWGAQGRSVQIARKLGSSFIIDFEIMSHEQEMNTFKNHNLGTYLKMRNELNMPPDICKTIRIQNKANVPYSILNREYAKAITAFNEGLCSADKTNWGDYVNYWQPQDALLGFAEVRVGNEITKSVQALGRQIANTPPFAELTVPFADFLHQIDILIVNVGYPSRLIEPELVRTAIAQVISEETSFPESKIVIPTFKLPIRSFWAAPLFPLTRQAFENTKIAEIFHKAIDSLKINHASQPTNIDRTPVSDYVSDCIGNGIIDLEVAAQTN